MSQVITKNNIIFGQTKVNYPPEIVKSMKLAGYKVKNVEILPYEKELEKGSKGL